jgi:hypothetical protein
MNTHRFIAESREAARAAQAKARRWHARMVEFEAFCTGGGLVLTGLLLAFAYCLVTHQVPA